MDLILILFRCFFFSPLMMLCALERNRYDRNIIGERQRRKDSFLSLSLRRNGKSTCGGAVKGVKASAMKGANRWEKNRPKYPFQLRQARAESSRRSAWVLRRPKCLIVVATWIVETFPEQVLVRNLVTLSSTQSNLYEAKNVLRNENS